jgi:hypothetical protein
LMEKQVHTVGERADKFCTACGEERGHVVVSVTRTGNIWRVSCPKCGAVSACKIGERRARRPPALAGPPYDRTRLYRKGQLMVHQTYGEGEVTALVEPRKIDVLFPDRMRRLVHAQ